LSVHFLLSRSLPSLSRFTSSPISFSSHLSLCSPLLPSTLLPLSTPSPHFFPHSPLHSLLSPPFCCSSPSPPSSFSPLPPLSSPLPPLTLPSLSPPLLHSSSYPPLHSLSSPPLCGTFLPALPQLAPLHLPFSSPGTGFNKIGQEMKKESQNINTD